HCSGTNWVRLRVPERSISAWFRSASRPAEIPGRLLPLTQHRFTRRGQRPKPPNGVLILHGLTKHRSNWKLIPKSELLREHLSPHRRQPMGKAMHLSFIDIMLPGSITICDWKKAAR